MLTVRRTPRRLLASIACLALLLCTLPCLGWGRDGHKVIGAIAWPLMTDKAKAAVEELLHGEGLDDAGNWADEIRNDKSYDWAKPMHYVKP